MYEHLIIDFETLGVGKQYDNFIVLDVAVLPFNITDSDDFDTLLDRVNYFKFDTSYQKEKLGWKAEDETMEWWKTQDKELQKKTLLPSKDDVNLRTFTQEFAAFYTNMGTKNVWCRGMNFDVPLLARIFRSQRQIIEDLIHYSAYNDVRTYLRSFIGFEKRDDFIPEGAEDVKFEKHNPKHDVAMDVLRLQYVNNY